MEVDSAIQQLVIRSAVGSLLTLYMMAILLRWLAPWLEVELSRGPLSLIPRLVDPLISLLRRLLPPMGPMDWGPLAAVVLVWIARLVLVNY